MGWPESRGMIRRAIQLSLSVVALLAATRAPGQWVHFQDRTSGSLVVAPGGDDREKDCGLGDFDRDGWQDIVVVRKRASEVVVSGVPVAVEDVLPQAGSRIYYRAERLTVLPR